MDSSIPSLDAAGASILAGSWNHLGDKSEVRSLTLLATVTCGILPVNGKTEAQTS